MASFFQEDLHSSDSDDDDYVPNPGEVSSDDYEEEPFPAEKNAKINRKRKSNKNIVDSEERNEKNETFEEKESRSIETKVDEKQRANDLFKSFLEEVEAEMKVKEPSIFSPGSSVDSPVLSSDSGIKSNVNTSYENTPENPSCELFDFAGETVAVSVKDGVKIASAEESTATDLDKNKSVNLEKNVPDKPENQPPVMKRKGLQSVLTTIMNKKQKLSTLEKSSLDWNLYKKEHNIAEDLKKFNKGRGGFIERQRFLERSDVRSYEIERDLRMSKGKKKH